MKLAPVVRRRVLVGAALVVLFTITGFLILPPIVRTQLERRLSATLGREVAIEKVRVNPYALSLTLEGLAIRERDGRTPFLGWRRLYVNFDALASLGGEWVLSAVSLDGFDAQVTVNPDQSFNFSDLLQKLAPPAGPESPTAKPPRPLRVAKLEVTDARIEITDRSRPQPFATTIGPLTFAVSEFQTAGRRGAPYRFEAVTEAGERFVWSGTLQAAPFRSAGELRLEHIRLPKYAPYYAERMQAELAGGMLSVRGRYELNLAADARVLKLTDGALQLRDFKLLERPGGEPVVELPMLDLSGVQLDALARRVRVGALVLGGGHVRVRREKDGALNLLALARPRAPAVAPPAGASAAAVAPEPLPDVAVDKVELKGFQVEVTDLAAPQPARLALNELQLSLEHVTLADGAKIPVQFAAAWAPRGSVRLAGEVGLRPLTAKLKVEVTDGAILPLSPYLEQFVNARITAGAFTTALDLQADLAGEAPALTAAGDVRVEHLGLVDSARNEELAGFASLHLGGVRVSTAPAPSASIETVELAGSYARVVVDRDQSLNLAGLLRAEALATPPAPGTPPAVARAAAPAPKIEIGRIVLTEGDYRFADRSLEPNVRLAIEHFGGAIAGLSSTQPGRGDVDLKAVVDGSGPIAITGRLDVLGAAPSVDLAVDFKNVDLLPLSPYSGKFAGYELARGKLALDVKLRVNGPQLDAANVITLNQFTFGRPVESPAATHLPVRLGVALLKDLDGRIVIDVPVQGRTDDPAFRIGRVVLRVIVNLLTKAAVSPFSLLGAAFGGGGDELAYQEFTPGSAELQPAEQKKLETMARALANRPGLSLDLEGSYDGAADAYALKRLKLADQVRRAVWEQKHAIDPNVAAPSALAIGPEENAVMIKKLFDEKFPPGTPLGTPVPPPPAVAAPPAPPAGLFRRFVAAITFRATRERRAAEQENARQAAAHEQAVAAAVMAGLPVDEMAGRLAETIAIDENDLRALAQARARRVRDYFVQVGQISADRLFLAKDQTGAPAGKGPRVFLTLQ